MENPRLEKMKRDIEYINDMLSMMGISPETWWETPNEYLDGGKPSYSNTETLKEYVENLLIDYSFADAKSKRSWRSIWKS